MIINDNKYRIPFLIFFVVIFVGIFIFRLAQLQIVQGDHYKELAENKIIQKINITAPRGSIITQDGYAIAKNKIGYSVELAYTRAKDKEQNAMLLTLYNILSNNNEKFEDEFPILIENGEFVFTFDKEAIGWKKNNNIPLDASAEEVLGILRKKYNLKDEVNNEVAIEAIEKIHMSSNLPLMVVEGDIVFTYKDMEIDWKIANGFKEKEGEYEFDPQESFNKMRKKYSISEEYSDDDARKILVFKETIKTQGFRTWQPIELASNVSLETVADVDARIHEMPGIVINAKPIRYYPYNDLAAHVLGYIGKVSEGDIAAEDSIYKMTDLKGISGIEASFESYLKGVDGEEFAVTDYVGRPQNDPTQEVINPVAGSDVHLTLDFDLQQAAEKALEEEITKIQENGKAPNAQSGAVVALDVNTGAVLAMASYPDYDLNLFSTGISSKDWKELNILVDDPLYPRPLYNNATLTAIQPGSTFKPLMAIAALETGTLTEKTRFYCPGYLPRYPSFTCLGYHGSDNIVEGIRDSCNVFFYETGLRLGIDNIEDYATQFGLGSKTGIEIPESSGYLATKEDKKISYMLSSSSYIRNTVGIMENAFIINDKGEEIEVYKSYAIAKELFDQIPDGYLSYGNVFKIVTESLSKYNIKESTYLHRLTQYILESRWDAYISSDTINASIGQGLNSFTPIQMANMVATLVNGGNHMETYLVDEVISSQGKTVYKHDPVVLNKVDIDPENLALVKEGMRQVAVYSSGASGFRGFDHKNIGVGGKTGTAQYGSERIDNTAWFESFTPFDKPEIVVVAMIVQGDKSAYSVPIARQVIDAYYYNNSSYEERQKSEESKE